MSGIEDIEFNKAPDFEKILESKEHIVVVGAGIIGVCTAYYLVRHPKYDRSKHHITILESKRVAGGASGKAGGLLATWAFPQQIVPLSFQLHQELSDEFGGELHWDYRRLTTVSLEADVREGGDGDNEEDDDEEGSAKKELKSRKLKTFNESHPEVGCCLVRESGLEEEIEEVDDERGNSRMHDSDSDDSGDEDDFGTAAMTPRMQASNKKVKELLPSDLYWIKNGLVKDWSSLGGTDSTAQVHPYKFTHFLLKKAMELGSVDLILGKITKIHYAPVEQSKTTTDTQLSSATGVTYLPTDDSDLEGQDHAQEVTMDATQVILCMGPWTSKILPDCPISGLRAHSITIRPEQGTVSPYAIFTELQVGENEFFSPEMYARKDEVYVCGEGDTMVSLPETTDDVEVVRAKCDELFAYVSKLSTHLSRGHVLKRQACYLPVLNVPTSSGPLIGETNVDNLFVASGHSCWGINNAPVTGKVLSELIFDGESKCCDISALDPGLYFDASL